MRVFSQGQLAQGCARMLVAAFLWSALCSGIVTVPASAQVTTRSVTDQSVAVVPFQYAGAYHPDTFGEEAAAAVAVDLEQRLGLDVLPAGETALEMKNLGLKPPLDTSSLVRLATNLEVNMLVWGDVRQARVVADNGERRAVVTLAVRLFDRFAQADTNGSLVTSYSPPKAEASDDELISLALKQAVFDTITEMKGRPAITATVIWAKGDQIFTNTGTRGGINVGTRLVAVRDRERIAVVQIMEANATGADGKVISGTTLRTGDHLLAIYDLPGTEAKPTIKQSIKRKASGMEKPAIMLGAIALLAGFAGSSRAVEEGNKVVPGLTASNLANGTTMGIDVDVSPLVGPVNLITWTKFSNSQSKRVIAYKIFRGELLIDVVPISFAGGVDYVMDQDWPVPGSIGTQFNFVTMTVVSATGELGLEAGGDSWNPDLSSGTPNPTYQSWHDGLSPLGEFNDGTTWSLGFIHFPLLANVQTYYRVKPVIIVNNPLSDGTPVWTISTETELGTPSNPTTGVPPPTADQARKSPLNGNIATFSFYQPMGADEMILQVQRDQGDGSPVDFAPGPTLFQKQISGLNPSLFPGLQPINLDVNVSDLQALQGTSTVYWWRVGARNRADQTQPRPFPLSRVNDYGWVWDAPGLSRFDLGAGVAARAAGIHPEREQMKSLLLGRRQTRVRTMNRPMSVPERH